MSVVAATEKVWLRSYDEECDVTDTDGRLVTRAMSTCMTLRGESSEGR